jgi:hypothetical protein
MSADQGIAVILIGAALYVITRLAGAGRL